MMVKVKRAVIYTRVSNDKAGGGRSVAEQEVHCRKDVERNDWSLVHVYSDNDRGASEFSSQRRPEWMQLLADLERGAFDVLVIWEPSRASRDRGVWSQLQAMCEEHKVSICVNGRTYDLSDPDDAFSLDLFAILARREVAMTRKRVMRALGSSAELGRPGPGKCPFGYARVYDDKTGEVKTMIPDLTEHTTVTVSGETITWTPFEIAKEIFSKTARGTSAYTITRSLNDRGIKNPRTLHRPNRKIKKDSPEYGSNWNATAIRAMVQNVAYLGHRTHHGKITVENGWEPLVRKEDFWAIQAMFLSRKTNQTRTISSKHLATGIGICSVCGNTLKSTNTKLAGDAYRCAGGHVFVSRQDLEVRIEWEVLSWVTLPSNLDQLRDASHDAEEVSDLRADLMAVEADIAEWDTLAEDDDDLSPAVYMSKKKKLTAKKMSIEQRLYSLGLPPSLHAFGDGRNPVEVWRDMPMDARREVVRQLLTIKVNPVGRGKKNVPFDLRVTIEHNALR